MNGYELLAKFEKEIKECFTVPNHWLPLDFQDQRTDCVSLADIENKCNARDKTIYMSAAEEDNIERAKRVEIYREQLEQKGKIEYQPNP